MSARREARAGDPEYRDPTLCEPFALGSVVRCAAGIGTIEFVAFSACMESHVYTVALDTRTKLRLVSRDIEVLA